MMRSRTAPRPQGIEQPIAVVKQQLPVDRTEQVAGLEPHRGVETVRRSPPDAHEVLPVQSWTGSPFEVADEAGSIAQRLLHARRR